MAALDCEATVSAKTSVQWRGECLFSQWRCGSNLKSTPVPVVFCITDLDRGGAERALVQLVLNLDRQEWDPAVICLGPPGVLVETLETAGIPVDCLHARNLLSTPRVLWALTRELRRRKPALVQTFLFHANILGRIAARLAGVRVVISGIRVAERRNRWHGRIDRWTNHLVDTNVCVSRGVAEFSATVTGLDRRKLIIIPNAVDADQFVGIQPADLTPMGIPSGSRVLISVGRLESQKGFDVLVEAISLCDSLPEDVYFLIVGDGPQSASLHQQVERKELQRRIRFAGRRNDVPELLAASMAFILSSRWEGMPNVILEAMAAGLPIITTNVEGTDELVQDGVNGIVVAPAQPAALRSAIESLLARPDFVPAAGNASQAIAAKDFTPLSVASLYAATYRKLLTSARI